MHFKIDFLKKNDSSADDRNTVLNISDLLNFRYFQTACGCCCRLHCFQCKHDRYQEWIKIRDRWTVGWKQLLTADHIFQQHDPEVLLLDMPLRSLLRPQLIIHLKKTQKRHIYNINCMQTQRRGGVRQRQEGGEGKGKGEGCGLRCRVEGVKLNRGSYHPINKLSVIWNSESDSDSETDTETAQVGCASLIFN